MSRLDDLIQKAAIETGIPAARIRRAFQDSVTFIQEEVIQQSKCRRVRLFKLGTLTPASQRLGDYIEKKHPERNPPSIDDVIDNYKKEYGSDKTGR